MAIKRHESLNIHPGIILKNMIIEPAGLTIAEASQYLNTTRLTLSNIINGKSGISPNMAIKISIVFGGTPEFWYNLQNDYDLFNAELNFNEELQEYSYDNNKAH